MATRERQQIGSYKLVRRLGHGGFADVYLGEHLYLKTNAAIKVLRTKLGDDNDLTEFKKEVLAVEQINHPGIIRIRDFGVEDTTKTAYLVMDYAQKGTLRDRHLRGARVPLYKVATYIKQLAPALQHAHDTNWIHRDIKPENILIGANDEILLGDFGIVAVAHRTSSMVVQNRAGTPAYMAPEQYTGTPRRESDQYALAIVVYELLCGETPFNAPEYPQMQYQHLSIPPPSLRKNGVHIPARAEQAIMKALSKDPRQRYSSVTAFANALESASKSEMRKAAQSGFLSQTPTKVRVWSIALPQMFAIVLGTVLYGGTQMGLNFLSYMSSNQAFLTHQPLANLDVASLIQSATSLNWLTFLVGIAFLLPLFFGAVFGPWVGLLVGGVGSFLGDYLLGVIFPTSSWGGATLGWDRYFNGFNITHHTFDWKWYAGNALLGFIAGLILAGTKRDYRGFGTFLAIELISLIALVFGLLVVVGTNILLFQAFGDLPIALDQLVTLGIPAALASLIILPIALTIVGRITNR